MVDVSDTTKAAMIEIRKKMWGVVYRKFGKQDIISKKTGKACGWCCRKTHLIEIDKTLKGQSELMTLLHEGLHACCRDFNEKAIKQISVSLNNILWTLGYRRRGD